MNAALVGPCFRVLIIETVRWVSKSIGLIGESDLSLGVSVVCSGLLRGQPTQYKYVYVKKHLGNVEIVTVLFNVRN